MKNIYLTLFCFSIFIANSQEIATTESGRKVLLSKNGTYEYLNSNKDETIELKSSNFIFLNGIILTKADSKVSIRNYENNQVACKLIVYINDSNRFKSLDNVDFNLINKMIKDASLSTILNVKNKYTYIPRLVDISYSKGMWEILISYSAQNDYGATKDGKEISYFDETGKKISREEYYKKKEEPKKEEQYSPLILEGN